MFETEISTTWSNVGYVILSSAAMLIGTIVYVRLAGLRSFSKMSSFDFAVTIAFGSLLAATVLSQSSLVEGLVAAGALLGFQVLIALARSRLNLSSVVDNEPLVLMRNGSFNHANLAKSRVTEDDVRAKLRESNVVSYEQVRAVVLETTGDVSVLHGPSEIDDDLLRGVRR